MRTNTVLEPVAVGSVEVVLEPDPRRHLKQTVYWLLIPLLLYLWIDVTSPTRHYNVLVRDADEGRVLHREGLYTVDVAISVRDEMAVQIGRVGLSEFLFKKEHVWRID